MLPEIHGPERVEQVVLDCNIWDISLLGLDQPGPTSSEN